MARVCDICGKKPGIGHSVSHAHNLTKRRWLPNLRRVRAMVDGRVTNLNVCTKCIKAGKVAKAPHKERVRTRPAPVAAATEENLAAADQPQAVDAI